MSNKAYTQLDRSDLALRKASPVGMDDGVKQIILRVAGFELFNTRPYHNYETWSDGYTVIGRKDRKPMPLEEVRWMLVDGARFDSQYLEVSAEDLDDACSIFAAKLQSLEKASVEPTPTDTGTKT